MQQKEKLDQSILTEKIKRIQNYPKFLEKYNITFKDVNPFFDLSKQSEVKGRVPNDEHSIQQKNLRRLIK